MKKKNILSLQTVFIVLLVFFISEVSLAQPNRNSHNRMQNGEMRGPKPMTEEELTDMMNILTIELSLTAEQKEELSDIFNKHYEEMKIMKEEVYEDKKAPMEFHALQRKKLEKKVAIVLNEEQFEMYKVFMKEHREDQLHERIERTRSRRNRD